MVPCGITITRATITCTSIKATSLSHHNSANNFCDQHTSNIPMGAEFPDQFTRTAVCIKLCCLWLQECAMANLELGGINSLQLLVLRFLALFNLAKNHTGSWKSHYSEASDIFVPGPQRAQTQLLSEIHKHSIYTNRHVNSGCSFVTNLSCPKCKLFLPLLPPMVGCSHSLSDASSSAWFGHVLSWLRKPKDKGKIRKRKKKEKRQEK